MARPDPSNLPEGSIVLPPDGGRTYELGAMRAVFKADGEETDNRYSVSEWWLEPRTAGPGAHHHEHNDEIFYVLEGTATFLIGERWLDVPRGTFLRIPAGTNSRLREPDRSEGRSFERLHPGRLRAEHADDRALVRRAPVTPLAVGV